MEIVSSRSNPQKDHTMIEYSRLQRTLAMIANHPYYPGKAETIQECLDDLDAHYRKGEINLEQRSRLTTILLSGASSRAEVSACR